ncbi:MAG: hypothetical protein HZA94_02440 [Candidatus Vogelbacteria bacterium]|nr:hypothetical protein [Candidatus Vogelbacteria bacterium]
MENTKQSRLILYLSFTMLIFYPMKGLVPAAIYLSLGYNVAPILISLISLAVIILLGLNLLFNRVAVPTNIDKLLFLIGCFAMLMGVVHREFPFFQNTLILFFLQPAFYKYLNINNRYYSKCVVVFLLLTTIYLSAEHIITQPARFGLTFDPPTDQTWQLYVNSLATRSDVLKTANLQDFHKRGWPLRLGGYLSSVLAMPVLLAMSTTFFYVWLREKFSLWCLGISLINVYLLLNSLSTTAVAAFLLTFLFYELYVKRKITSLIVVIVCLIGFIIVITTSRFGVYFFNRVITNLFTVEYTEHFFSYYYLLQPSNALALLIGAWRYFHSHVDLINIPATYGVIPAFFLFKRMLFPLGFLYKTRNLQIRRYSVTVLTAFICFFHHTMTLNINVMILVTLLFLKAGDLYRREQKEALNGG